RWERNASHAMQVQRLWIRL
ncbi:hypothetical protein RvY_19433, partial [Ramazzottius varieornatus]